MAKLSSGERNKLPDSAFAGKGRSFPVEDKKHARAAIMLSGKAPPSERAHIKERAREVLGEKSKKGEKFLGAPMHKVMGKKKDDRGGY